FLRNLVFKFVSLSLLSIGFAQVSGAAMIGTQQLIDHDMRGAQLTRVASLLARQDVAEQLVAFGVDPQLVQARVANLTDAELAALEGKLDQQIAGGNALGIIGAVFLVLMILEFVGVIDIFKAR
ncbi:MAG: PA2779 family protein, partial [Woeseia sp.]